MLLKLGNLSTRVASASATELDWLRGVLSFADESRAFVRMAGRVERVEPPVVSLFDERRQSFPAGLTSKVVRDGLAGGVSVDVVDGRTRPCEVDLSVATDWLRPYQRESAERALTKTKGILKLPTGAGKTEIAVAMAMLAPEARWLMVTPEKDLMHNAARRYELRTGLSAGRVGDGIWQPDEHFTAATFQTLASGLRSGDARVKWLLAESQGMIVDEVHTLPADTAYSVAQSCPAYWRIGMSGTPLARGDRKSLFSIAATGSIIHEVRAKFLIENGWLSMPKIRMVELRQGGVSTTYRKAYTELVTESRTRNLVLAGIAVQAAKPGLLFVREKKHGRIMVDHLKARGLRTEFVWGEKSTSQRDDAIRRLEWGDLDIIVCSKVFVTGTDIPSLRSIINGMAGKSEIETLQRLGRGMRVAKDKTAFEMWDVKDAADPPTGANRWNHRHANERFKAYVEQDYEVIVLKDFIP